MKRLYKHRYSNKTQGTMGCLVGRVRTMSDPSARRNQCRALADQQAETLARYVLRSEAGSAQPSDGAWTRLQAGVGTPPRPVRPVVPPPSRGVLWGRSFITAAPAMSGRLSSVSAA